MKRGKKYSEIELEDFLKVMEKPKTNKDLCKIFSVSREVIRKCISKLYDEGLLRLVDSNKGLYQLDKKYICGGA